MGKPGTANARCEWVSEGWGGEKRRIGAEGMASFGARLDGYTDENPEKRDRARS